MTTPQPSSTTTLTRPAQQSPSSALGIKTETPRWMHYGAWSVAILGPVVLFMPPRRVGFQAIVIASGTFAATNLLVYDYTGTTLMGRFKQRFGATTSDNKGGDGSSSSSSSYLPEKARRTQELLRLEREKREAALPEAERRALQEARDKKERESRGLFASLWMGDANQNWREERRKKEEEALSEGKGYGDLIVEQVKEVFASNKEGDNSKDAKNDTDDKK